MKIPQYETGWYYVTGHRYINGIIKIGWCDAKSGIYSDAQDSHDIYKDKDLLKIAKSDDLICWFLILRPKNYDINEGFKRISEYYDLSHSKNFYQMFTDAFARESLDGTEAFVIDKMNMDSSLEW
jgi:hypothetical protein